MAAKDVKFGTEARDKMLRGVNGAVEGLGASTQAGTAFVFGFLAGGLKTPDVLAAEIAELQWIDVASTDVPLAPLLADHIIPLLLARG